MEKILLNWLKLRILNCKVQSPERLEAILNQQANKMCTFKVSPDWEVQLYDESNFVKTFKLTVENNLIKDIQ